MIEVSKVKDKCEYCNSKSTIMNRMLLNPILTKPSEEQQVIWNGYIVKDYLEQMLTCNSETWIVRTDINYCPICGRKLK